jgi:hypothetical protein
VPNHSQPGSQSRPLLVALDARLQRRVGESALDAKRTQFHPDTGHVGPFLFEEQDVAQWLKWEIDYMKYDWCPIDIPYTEQNLGLHEDKLSLDVPSHGCMLLRLRPLKAK